MPPLCDFAATVLGQQVGGQSLLLEIAGNPLPRVSDAGPAKVGGAEQPPPPPGRGSPGRARAPRRPVAAGRRPGAGRNVPPCSPPPRDACFSATHCSARRASTLPKAHPPGEEGAGPSENLHGHAAAFPLSTQPHRPRQPHRHGADDPQPRHQLFHPSSHDAAPWPARRRRPLRHRGRVAVTNAAVTMAEPGRPPEAVHRQRAQRPRDYAEIEAVLASGAVRSMIDRVVPLAQASEAFAASETGGRAGKGVIAVGERRRSRLAPGAACLVGAGRASAPPPTRPGLRSGRRCGPVMRLGRRHPREIQQPLGDSPPMA